MAQWMIGETYFHQKNYDDAIPAYLRVEILYDYPQWNAAGLLQAAKCYELRRDYRAAVELYARLLSEYPDTPYRQQASERLRFARKELNDGAHSLVRVKKHGSTN